MQAAELRNKSVTELDQEILDLTRELFSLRMQRGSGQLKRNHMFKEVRRSIARVKTVLAEKQLTEKQGK